MKKHIAILIIIAGFALSFGDASGHISFVPKRANVGNWGPSGQNLYYWVMNSSYTWFNLGPISDASAKAKYATVLAAMAAGKTIEIGIWARTITELSVVGAQISDIPEYVSMLDQ